MATTQDQNVSTEDVVRQWLQGATQIQEKDIPQLLANRQASEAAAAQQQQAIDQKAAADTSVAQQQADLTMQRELRISKLANTAMPEDLSLALAASVREAVQSMQDTQKKVHDKQSVGFLDNPLAYVLNTLQLPDLQTKLAQNVETVNMLTAARDKVNDSITAEARMLDATKKTTTPGIVAAQADATIAKAQYDKATASIEAIRNNTQGLMTAQQMDMNSRNMLDKANDAFMRGQQFELAQQRMAMDMKMASMQLEKASRAAADDRAEDAVTQSMMQTALMHAKAVGDTSIPQVTSLAEMKALLKMPGMAEKLAAHAGAGAITANSGNLMYGADPNSAIHNILTQGWQVPEGSKRVVNQVMAAQDAYIADPKNNFAAMPANKQAAALAQVAKMTVQNMQKLTPDMVMQQEENASVKMAQLPMFKAIEWDTNPAVRKDTDALRSSVVAAINAGKLSMEDAAAGLTYFSARQSDATNRYYNILGFGIPTPLSSPIVEDGKVYNLAKVEDAYKWLAVQRRTGSLWNDLFSPAAYREKSMAERVLSTTNLAYPLANAAYRSMTSGSDVEDKTTGKKGK